MAAKLTGTTAKSRLAQSLGANFQGYQSQWNGLTSDQQNGVQTLYDANRQQGQTADAAMSNAFTTYGTKPVTDQAKAINQSAVSGAGAFTNSTSGISKTSGMSGIASAVGSTDYGAQRNSAVEEYGKAVWMNPEGQAAYDRARSDYESSLTGGKTLEQGLNELRQQKGVADIESRLNQTNDLMRQNQEGLRRATELNPTGSGALIQSSLDSLRSASSRDYIRNLSYLSNVRANTVDELNTANQSIDTLLGLRQQDRANKQADLKARIDLLSSRITPEQKEYLKMKLDAKLAGINQAESVEAERVKAINAERIKRDFSAGDINSKDPTLRRIAIENAVANVTSRYKQFPGFIQRSDSQIADEIQNGLQNGTYKDLADAVQRNLVTPISQKPELQQIQQKLLGTQYDYKPIQGTDANGNLITTGYMAVNPNDPTDAKFVSAVPGGSAPSSWGYETSSGYSSGTTDLSSLYTGNNGPAFANNNPGNIKDTAFGGTPNGKGGFTKYATVEEGINALLTKIRNAQTGKSQVYSPDMTIEQFFSKYAPSSDNNNPKAYAKFVASYVGAKSGSKIKDVDPEMFAAAIMKHENGAMYGELVKRGIVGPEGITIGKPQQQAENAPAQSGQFDASLVPVYQNIITDSAYPAGVKPTSENGKKLYQQALAWKESQKGSWLSTMAQNVVDGSIKLKDLSSDDRSKVLSEFSNKNAYTPENGNAEWMNTGAEDRKAFLDMKKSIELLNEVKTIRDKYRESGNDMVGPIDSSMYDIWQRNGWLTGKTGQDYNRMQQILQKNVNTLLKERSGAAVSNQELSRLLKEVPNLSMGGSQFDDALDNAISQIQNSLDNFSNAYHFRDSQTMLERAAGKKVSGSAAQNQQPNYQKYF